MFTKLNDFMSNKDKTGLKVMIVEDDEDILTLYRDYLLTQGHDIVCSNITANDIIADFERTRPDICLIDYILFGSVNGIDAVMDILKKYPLTPILIMTAYGLVSKELTSHPELIGKNIQVLLKPVRLPEIEDAMWKLLQGAKQH